MAIGILIRVHDYIHLRLVALMVVHASLALLTQLLVILEIRLRFAPFVFAVQGDFGGRDVHIEFS